MNIISKYIGKILASVIILVILVLAGLETFIEFSREFTEMGTGDYGLLQVLSFVPMILPSDIYQLFPMAGLLGSIIGLGLLAANSELIVMRANGVAIINITWSVLKVALIITFFMVIIGEVIGPQLQQLAVANKTAALSQGQTFLSRQGIWLRYKNNFIHINKMFEKHIDTITKFSFDDQSRLQLISTAKSGDYQNDKWIFNNVKQTEFSENRTKSAKFDTQEWGINISPKVLGLTTFDTDQKSLPELFQYIKYRKQSGLDPSRYEFIFWQRSFQPLATLVMIILAVPFVFGPLRSASMGLRMLTGVITGFGFHILNQFLGPLSIVYQVPPIIAAIAPSLIFAALGGFWLTKLR